jgi:hypothetical protein
VQFNCVKKTARKIKLNVLWLSTGFPSGLSVFCQICVSSFACDCSGYKQGCRLLLANHIGHNFVRKEEKKA